MIGDGYSNIMKAKAYILDGSGYLYRAYHGMPPMVNRDGQPMQMVYGFCKMMLALLREQPDYFVIVWDTPSKTVRHDADVTYKANRVKMPSDFGDQIKVIHEIMSQIWLSQVACPWYEADDVLYSFALHNDPSVEYHIYTADKDIKQVLKDWVFIQDPMKQETRDHMRFQSEYGFTPELMVDYLTLVGDVSDNVPWVAGIGPKMAQELVSKFGGLWEIYMSLDQLSEKTRNKLVAAQDTVAHSRKMIQLYDVPALDIAIEHYGYNLDFTQLKAILVTQVGFPSMAKWVDDLKASLVRGMQQGLF